MKILGRVYLVDDDELILDMLSRALSREGYETRTASSGVDIVEKIRSWHPDVVLLDINLPGQSGMDTLQELKNRRNVVWSANAYPIYGMAGVDSLLRVMTKSSGITKNSAMPFQLVTSVNAGTVTLPYVEPSTALAQYKKLWKVK